MSWSRPQRWLSHSYAQIVFPDHPLISRVTRSHNPGSIVPLASTPRCNILYTLAIQFNVNKEKERERF